eukprot:6177446-Pleurochrysis_carterae.AAC.4
MLVGTPNRVERALKGCRWERGNASWRGIRQNESPLSQGARTVFSWLGGAAHFTLLLCLPAFVCHAVQCTVSYSFASLPRNGSSSYSIIRAPTYSIIRGRKGKVGCMPAWSRLCMQAYAPARRQLGDVSEYLDLLIPSATFTCLGNPSGLRGDEAGSRRVWRGDDGRAAARRNQDGRGSRATC